MSIDDRSELEKANQGLYRPDVIPRPKPRAKLHRDHRPVPTSWKQSTAPTTAPGRTKSSIPPSLFSKLFIGSVIFFIIAIAITVITIATSANVSNRRINLEVLGRTFVDGGETLPLQVVVGNNNTTQIELADVVIEYPTSSGIERVRRSVGTVAARQQVIENFDLVLFGEEGSTVPMDITLEYRIPDSNAILTKSTTYEVVLRSTPIVLSVLGPQSSLPNQTVTVNYTVVSNSSTLVEDIALVTEYPAGFEFASATPAPSFSNNVWVLGDLEPGTTRTIAVTGVVRGSEGEITAFKGTIGRQDSADEKKVGTAFATVAYPLPLDPPFLLTELLVNGSSEPAVIVTAKQDLDISVRWSNPLPVRIQDARIDVLLGGAFDGASITAQEGFYDSATQTIIWSTDGNSEFQTIEPGESGQLSFRMKPKITNAQGQIITDPVIQLQANIFGTVEGGIVQSAQSVDELRIGVASDFVVLAEVQHATGVLVNSGPLPPQVGQQTTYTIAWSVTNSSSTVTDGVVRTTLPQYVTWLAIVAPQQTPITYNATTREVVWNVGAVEAGAGYTKPAKTVSFKVGLTPSASQVNTTPAITSAITLSGVDTFTQAQLQSNRTPLTTRLLNEGSTVGSDGRVVQ